MEVIWKNPYSKVTEDILVGSTTFRVQGLFTEATKGDAETAPTRPEFEIEVVFLMVNTSQGIFPLDITKMLDDVNSVTWKKDCSNDFFEYLSNKVIEKQGD